ncbi:MAG: DoxX family protein [Caldilineaceae bacterium]
MRDATMIHDSKLATKQIINVKAISYWLATAILAFVMFSGGIGELTHNWGTLETVTILGYPAYILTILGVWKILGTVALLVPGFPRLKEWAYAGLFFNMTGAAVSHAMSNDYGAYAFHIVVPLTFAGLAVLSWALRPPSRMLGVLLPTKHG